MFLVEAAQDGGVPDCMYLLGAMGTALVVVTGALVKAVTVAWKERELRVSREIAFHAETQLMLKAANEKKGGS